MSHARIRRTRFSSGSASRSFLATCLFGGACVALLTGCDRERVDEQGTSDAAEPAPVDTATSVARDESPARDTSPAADSGTMTAEGVGDAGATDAAPARPWAVPAGWTEDPEPRRMRLATIIAPGPDGPVEVAVTRFPGRVGGDLANMNRWRGGMGLEPVTAETLETTLDRFESPGLQSPRFEGYVARIESDRGIMLAAAVFDASLEATWFARANVADAAAADALQDGVFGIVRSIAGLRD